MMKNLTFLFCLLVYFVGAQEYHAPVKSPRQVIKQEFSISHISVDYGKPSVKGRTIFGELVPFGKVWRLGANEATKIEFGQDVLIDGKEIKAGQYAFYAIPNADQWILILNKGVKNWGAYGYKQEDDIARFEVPVGILENPVESLSISFGETTSTENQTLFIEWENTSVQLEIEVANKEWVDEQIDALRRAKNAKKKSKS